MPASPSEYYPPRAKVPRGFAALGYALRRRTRVRMPEVPPMIFAPDLYLTVLVPGYGFATRGHLWVAVLAAAGWIVSVAAMLYFLGGPEVNFAIGAMVAVHATGAVHAIHHHVLASTWQLRILVRLAVALLMVAFLYFPTFQGLKRVVLPLQTSGGPVIINTFTSAADLERGDLVAYRIEGRQIGAVRLGSGHGLDRVIGLPGDHLVFREGYVEVNGDRYPHSQRGLAIPTSGELIVPEDRWYIWSSMNNLGNDRATAIRLLNEQALVPESNIIGKPFKRWFWRTQHEPV